MVSELCADDLDTSEQLTREEGRLGFLCDMSIPDDIGNSS
jgi:hypothetical protein